jgi:hypothetical protein
LKTSADRAEQCREEIFRMRRRRQRNSACNGRRCDHGLAAQHAQASLCGLAIAARDTRPAANTPIISVAARFVAGTDCVTRSTIGH